MCHAPSPQKFLPLTLSPLDDLVGVETALLIISPFSKKGNVFPSPRVGQFWLTVAAKVLLRLSLEGITRKPLCQYQGAGSLPTPFSSGRDSLCASVCVSIYLSLTLSDLCCLCLHSVYLCTALFLLFLFVSLVLYITPFSLFPTPRPSYHLQQFEGIIPRKGSLRPFLTAQSWGP